MCGQAICLKIIAAVLATCAASFAQAPASRPAVPVGPTVELARHIEKQLAADGAAAAEPWAFGVIADPHIYMYGWSDNKLAASLRSWVRVHAKFGVVVGDLGTGPSLRPDGDAQVRQMDKFAKTIAAVEGCPPVVVAMGNHELDGDGKAAWLAALYPGVVGGIEGKGDDRFFYYSFDYRGCHFVCLDANHVPPGGKSRAVLGVLPAEELAWLQKDLAASRGKLTFVFLHEPIEQVHYDTPYYLLKNRAALLGVLRRFPDVKWIFHGHLHYGDQVRWDGLNVVHCGAFAVRVQGGTAELCRITASGLEPVKEAAFFDLGAELAARRSVENGRVVLRIAEETLEPAGRSCSLKKATALVPAEGDVKPTHGETMLRVQMKLESRGQDSFTHLTRFLSTWDVIPIRKGMTFSYDVRCESSVYDNVALDLRIVPPPGGARVPLKDQDGVSMDNVHVNFSPSLGGRADGKWYHRTCDLSEMAGGWIDMITLCTIRPNGAPYPAGDLRMYLDNIRFSWPAQDKDGERPTAPAAR